MGGIYALFRQARLLNRQSSVADQNSRPPLPCTKLDFFQRILFLVEGKDYFVIVVKPATGVRPSRGIWIVVGA